MSRFLLRRTYQTVLLLFLISLFVFALTKAIPGDFLTEMEMNPAVSREEVEELRQLYHLNEPFYVQYVSWIGQIISGEFGYSFAQQRPAAGLLTERLANTLLLSSTAFLMILVFTFSLGITTALGVGRWPDRAGLLVTLFGLSCPPLLLALLGLYFAFKTGLFPIGGFGGIRHLVLPSLILAIPSAAFLARQLRLELLDALKQPFVTAAIARGLGTRRVVAHAIRDALNPMISLLGLVWGGLLSGSVIVEKVFSWPGLGSLVAESILSRDLFVVVNGILLSAVLIIFSNLVADVALALNDPRIRYR